jgi:hypothetical protein
MSAAALKNFQKRWCGRLGSKSVNIILGKSTPPGLRLYIMKPRTEPGLHVVSWDEVNRAFAPFVGTCLYAIRAEAFFHFAQRSIRPHYSRLKNLVYPVALWWRSRHGVPAQGPINPSEYLLVCDYAAEPGFGSLRPLLSSGENSTTLVVNSQVLAVRGRELAGLRGVHTVCADAGFFAACRESPGGWRKSQIDYQRLLETCSPALRAPVIASQRVLRALLLRAYHYGNFYERLFRATAPRGVITHNDFTALSYLAGAAARRQGIADFTLQHGFPSQEYFPAAASHYLVWGEKFQEAMSGRALNGTHFAVTGTPRLDSWRFREDDKTVARQKLGRLGLLQPGKLQVLFLSQSHTPVFSSQEHQQILAWVAGLAEESWIHMLVRLHPQETKGGLRRYPAFRSAAQLPRQISLAESVLAADVVISVNSTAMLEAALLHAPVIQLAPASFADRLGFLRFPCQAVDGKSAHAELLRLRDPEQRQDCVRQQEPLIQACVHESGHGTENVWNYVRSHSGDRQPINLTVAVLPH